LNDNVGQGDTPNRQPVYHSFVSMVISLLCLVSMYKIQKNFEVEMRQRGLINTGKSIINWQPFWNKVYNPQKGFVVCRKLMKKIRFWLCSMW